ncbi:AMP-binding protein [Streptomyces sp. NRRL F-5053]|uniref:AMP-binding protein n=1 Tax=Streptomyces sp. NRRL F-5053 TaxID=1463854 RepID=UPI0004C7B67F|nr:AMP-binding protein [Streptomyces sp. NRRL F-5053]
MSCSAPTPDQLDARTDRRSAHLYATDAQFRATAPLDAVSEAVRSPGLPLAALVATVREAYADRPALGARATRTVTDPEAGRTTLRLLERFDTLTYGEVASEWRHRAEHPVWAGDFVAVLGRTSAEYTVVDLACVRSGAVSVPLQAGASADRPAPVVEQTGPRLLAVDVDHLEVALQLAAVSLSLGRIVVLGHRSEVTARREKLDSARGRLAARPAEAALGLPLLHAFAEPEQPSAGSALPAGRFRAAVRAAALDEEQASRT